MYFPPIVVGALGDVSIKFNTVLNITASSLPWYFSKARLSASTRLSEESLSCNQSVNEDRLVLLAEILLREDSSPACNVGLVIIL